MADPTKNKLDLSWDDLLRLHSALKDAANAPPDARETFQSLIKIREEWVADRDAIAQEKATLREGFWYESRELGFTVLRLLKDGLYFILLWAVLWGLKWVTAVGLPMGRALC